ncbi:putative mitochondrial protein, partial [Mucuna pruriens]
MEKLDPKSDKGTFLGYSSASKAYKVYNSRTLTIEESIHYILGNVQDRVRIRSTFKGHAQVALLYEVKPKNIDDVLLDEGTSNLGLWYKKSYEYRLKGYTNADFAGDRIERKSTSGGCHFIGANLVSLARKRQSTITISMAEVADNGKLEGVTMKFKKEA